MKLGLAYDSRDDIPTDITIADLFEEKDGKFILSGIDGMKTTDDIARLQEALRKEKSDHSGVRDKYRPISEWLGDRTTDEVQAQLDELDELRARVAAGQGGEVDQEKIDELARKIAGREYQPKIRDLEKRAKKADELEAQVAELQTTITNGAIRDALSKAAAEAKIVGTAAPDVVAIGLSQFEVADDGSVVHKENGLDPAGWLTDQKEHRPHWWPNSTGGGAGGGKGGGVDGKNPWSKNGWSLTAQAAFINEHGDARADQMAAAAGTTVGGRRPT